MAIARKNKRSFGCVFPARSTLLLLKQHQDIRNKLDCSICLDFGLLRFHINPLSAFISKLSTIQLRLRLGGKMRVTHQVGSVINFQLY